MKEERIHRLLDLWSPPPGSGEPIACVATSYTFEQEFFEGQCLGRFLGLDSVRGEDDPWACLIEEEERLNEVRVTAIIDRGEAPSKRNLRWDLLPAGVQGGLMHAKVTLLVWQNLVRIVIGSANLTPAGYRSQVETCAVLDADAKSEIPEPVFLEALEALRLIASTCPGDPMTSQPKQRVLASIDHASRVVRDLRLPSANRSAARLAVVVGSQGHPVLPEIKQVWSGAVPRWASVLSPFFDSGDRGSPAAVSLSEQLAQRGDRSVRFLLPASMTSERTIVYAPRAITTSLPADIDASFETFDTSDEEPRRLHAKAVVLESEGWVAGLIGSSNFTAKGLGLDSRPHLEVNLAIGARRGSEAAKALLALTPEGDVIAPAEVDWEKQEDEDEIERWAVPWGFSEILLEPGSEPSLIVRFEAKLLPRIWRICRPSGAVLLDSDMCDSDMMRTETVVGVGDDPLFWVQVYWKHGEDERSASWPINVTDPSKLPPPEELRNLSTDALLEVLASSRPVHEAIALLLRRSEASRHGLARDKLDPLLRYSETGQLLKRARRVSAALAGLQRRLERPAANVNALEWRLEGPLGPLAIADTLLREQKTEKRIHGEPGFILVELALTLSRVEWESTASVIGMNEVRPRVDRVLAALATKRKSLDIDQWLAAYVDRAFKVVNR